MRCDHKRRKNFEPWKNQQKKAISFFLMAAFGFACAASASYLGFNSVAAVLAVVTVFLLSKSGKMFEQARSRQFGKELEVRSIESASTELEAQGIAYKANVLKNGVGDIDLVIGTRSGAIPVEIKSFWYWNQRGFIFHGARERKTIAQVRKQMGALRSNRGIVWLPQGKPSLFQRLFGVGSGPVKVVFGSHKNLVKIIKSI